MAAAIKAINAKIRSNKVLDYVCSTRTYRTRPEFPAGHRDRPGHDFGVDHEEVENGVFGLLARSSRSLYWRTGLVDRAIANNAGADFWGPVSNFGIPIAAVMDTQKDPDMYVPSLSYATTDIHPSSFISATRFLQAMN